MMSWALRSKEVEMRISSKQRSNRKSCDLRECLMRTRRMHGWVECKIWTNEYYRGRNHKNYLWKSSLTCCQLNNTGRHQVSSLTTPSKLTWQPRKKRLEAVTLHIDIPRRFRKLKKRGKSSQNRRRSNASTISRAIAVQSMPSAIDPSTSSNKSERATVTMKSLVVSTKPHASLITATASHTRLKLSGSCPSRTLRGRSARATFKRQKSKILDATQRS